MDTLKAGRTPLADIDPNGAISRAVRALIAAHALGQNDFADVMGMSYATARRRLKGLGDVGWTAAEVARVAYLFDQPLPELFAGKVDLYAIDPVDQLGVRRKVRLAKASLAGARTASPSPTVEYATPRGQRSDLMSVRRAA